MFRGEPLCYQRAKETKALRGYSNLVVVSFVSPPCEDYHYEVEDKSACNCHKYRDITSFTKSCKLSENLVKINRIWRLNEVPAK